MKAIKILLIFVAVFLVIKALQFFSVFKFILSLRFKQGDCKLCDDFEVENHILDIIVLQDSKLKDMGFSFMHCQLLDEVISTSMSEKHEFIYLNQEKNTYANVSVAQMPDKFIPATVEFSSFFSDGTQLLTVNCMKHNILGEIPNTIVRDKYAIDLQEQFAYHLEELQKLQKEKTPKTITASEYIETQQNYIRQYVQSQKELLTQTDNEYKFRIMPAIKIAFKSMKGVSKEKNLKSRIIKSTQANKTELMEIPIKAEINAFLKMNELMSAQKNSSLGNTISFIVSALVFIFAFGAAISVKSAIIIFIAVLIHELGHYLGMILFKYKDVNILFIPMLGAATISKQQKTTPLKEIIVYLLGPVPGILIGIFCLIISHITGIELLEDYAIFSLILNYINLIPIFPLDGGRIFELLIFSRAEFLKTAFKVLSVLLLGIAGLEIGDPIMLGFAVFLGIGTFFGIAQNFSLAKIKKTIRKQGIPNTEYGRLQAIFTHLKNKPFSETPFDGKFQIAKGLLAEIQNKPPGAGITIASMALYFSALILPVVMMITYGIVLGIAKAN